MNHQKSLTSLLEPYYRIPKHLSNAVKSCCCCSLLVLLFGYFGKLPKNRCCISCCPQPLFPDALPLAVGRGRWIYIYTYIHIRPCSRYAWLDACGLDWRDTCRHTKSYMWDVHMTYNTNPCAPRVRAELDMDIHTCGCIDILDNIVKHMWYTCMHTHTCIHIWIFVQTDRDSQILRDTYLNTQIHICAGTHMPVHTHNPYMAMCMHTFLCIYTTTVHIDI